MKKLDWNLRYLYKSSIAWSQSRLFEFLKDSNQRYYFAKAGEVTSFSRWWELKYVLCSSLFGEDEPSLTNIFQIGWNHQLVFWLFLGYSLVRTWYPMMWDAKSVRVLVSKWGLFLERCVWHVGLLGLWRKNVLNVWKSPIIWKMSVPNNEE